MRLDNKYYDRDRFKRDLETAIRKAVPHSRRALTPAELADVQSPAPYRYKYS